jgi:hypothetical protein
MKDGHPEPHYSLDGHCSIVHENTLYAYSSAGFQSLKLQEGAQWEKLPMDVSLTGAKCVKTEDKLFIVGGSVNETASTWNYPGLMHYTFKNKKWDWQRSESWNTQNRQNHGATYLPDSNKILVYSGSQVTGDVGPSPETFLISTKEPYSVQSFPSAGAPPSVKPLLLPWDSSTAVMIGGGAANTAVWTFSEAKGGWQNLGVTLDQGIANQDSVQCAVASGSDGSKVLLKFDMSVAPNKVDRIVLLGKDGVVAAPGTRVGDKAKRATISDWPAYNGTYAPKVTRSGFALAQGDDGTTVASGGNDMDPLCIFNAQENLWVNATMLFGGQKILTTSVSTSSSISSTTPTTIATPSSTPTGAAVAPAAAPPNNKSRMLTVLGATLGTIFGIAAVLILILICLKQRKKKSKQAQPAGYAEKDRMSFADRGADFMKEAGGSAMTYNNPMANDSTTSLAIIQGRGATSHKKNMLSDASTAGLVKKPSPLGYSEPVELSKLDMKPEHVNEDMVRQNSGRTPATKTNDRSRSSGWSRYFANNEATNLANMPSDRSTFASDRTSVLSQSQYTTSRMHSKHPSTYVPPLDIPKFDGQYISRVASGSPTLGSVHSSTLSHQPMQAELGRANSNGSIRSTHSYNDDRFFQKPMDSWTPVAGDNRPTSSAYTGSMILDSNYSKYDGASSYYPDGTESFYPKSGVSSFYPSQAKDSFGVQDTRDSTFTMFPSGKAPPAQFEEVHQNNFSSLYPAPPRLGMPQDRDSTVTMFPSGQEQTAQVEEMPPSKFSSMYPSPPRLDVPQIRDSTATVFPGGPQAQSAQIEHMPGPKVGSFFPPPRVGHESTATMFPGGPEDGKADNMSWLNLGASR